MNILTFDSLIVLIYLGLTLFVGIYKGRNIKNFREYAIGDYKFSDSTLIATITATWIGAGPLIGIHESVYQYGIVWLFIFLGGVLDIFIFQIISPKILRFKGCLSAAELLGAWYGPRARTIGGICVTLYSIGIIGTQVAAIGYLCQEFFHIAPYIGIIIGAGIVVLYSSFGGIKAVTYTDVIQFAFFIVAIPLIATIMIAKVGGYTALLEQLPTEHLKLFPSYESPSKYIVMLLFFSIPFCDACLIQRVLMAKDTKQIVTSFKSTAMVMSLFYIVCSSIALCAYTLNPNLEPNNVLYYVINNYLPVGIKGIGIAGVMAVVMSTADSYLNVSSVAIINDVINPLRKEMLKPKQELLIIKLTTFLIGSGAIFVAISSESITKLMLKTWIVWAPIAVVPLYAAILGIKSNFKTFSISAVVGALCVIAWNIFDIEQITGVDCVIPALGANLIAFTLASWYYKKFSPQELNNHIHYQAYKTARA